MSAPFEIVRLVHGLRARLLHRQWNLYMQLRCQSVSSQGTVDGPSTSPAPTPEGRKRAERISQAMKAYLERAQQFDDYMKAEVSEFEIGKRHLANIMGVDADSFAQKDVDRAIAYLLPSGLTDKKAHPMMKHPEEVIPQVKAAQFGMDGRPFHHMFYTCIPNYYELLHSVAVKFDALKIVENKQAQMASPLNKKLIIAGSQWVSKEVVEKRLKEKLQDAQYVHLTRCLERLADHPFSQRERDFIMQFRQVLQTHVMLEEVPPLMEDESGRLYMDAEGMRKRATASVRVYDKGAGHVVVNDRPMLDHFPSIMSREQIMYPLQLTGTLGNVDIHATVTGGGPSGQAGAIRLAIARALQSFVKPELSEQMRLAGLLTKDPRVKERQKPGQEGARRKYTWKKR